MERTHKTGARLGSRYVLRWRVSPLFDPHLTSGIVGGLAALVRTREVDLSMEPLSAAEYVEHVMRWEVREVPSGQVRRIALDLLDRRDLLDLHALAEADVYFKRTFDQEALALVEPGVRARIRPLGLDFGCQLRGSRWLIARALALAAVQYARRGSSSHGGVLGRVMQQVNDLAGLRHVSAYERQSTDRVTGRIVFQTRLWPVGPGHAVDRTDVNEERLRIVRGLRARFGDGDQIGLIRTAYAERLAPDLLLTRSVSRTEYARQLRTSAIAVVSHGLDGSGGFKIGESLAAGCALVSQPFKFELPFPLLEGTNYLAFQTTEQCVEQCERLLATPDLMASMRTANQEYYRRYVRPAALVRSLLGRAFRDSDDAPSGWTDGARAVVAGRQGV